MKEYVLFQNSIGVTYVRTDYVNRSKVSVRLGDIVYRVYRFNNCEPYVHPMLSWQNLDMCGGWSGDTIKTLRLVRDQQKPSGHICICNSSIEALQVQLNAYGYRDCLQTKKIISRDKKLITRCDVIAVCKENTALNEIFNIDEVLEYYERLGVPIKRFADISLIKRMCSEPMEILLSEPNYFIYNFANPKSVEEYVVTGLLLGYPVESTASILGEHFFVR